jgi:hypothetical protein
MSIIVSDFHLYLSFILNILSHSLLIIYIYPSILYLSYSIYINYHPNSPNFHYYSIYYLLQLHSCFSSKYYEVYTIQYIHYLNISQIHYFSILSYLSKYFFSLFLSSYHHNFTKYCQVYYKLLKPYKNMCPLH